MKNLANHPSKPSFICNHPITSTLVLIIEYFMESLSCVLFGTKGVFILHVVNNGVNNVHAQVHVMCRASHFSSPIIDVEIFIFLFFSFFCILFFILKKNCPCLKVPNFTKTIMNPGPPCLTYGFF